MASRTSALDSQAVRVRTMGLAVRRARRLEPGAQDASHRGHVPADRQSGGRLLPGEAVALVDTSRLGFAAFGAHARIYDLARITDPERVSIGSHVVIDDFVFIQGGQG